MKRKPYLLRGAEDDLLSAVEFYEAEQEGLGLRFHDEVAMALRRILDNPHQYSLSAAPPARRAVIRTFPFAIYYTVDTLRITIFAIHDCRSDPQRWMSRVP